MPVKEDPFDAENYDDEAKVGVGFSDRTLLFVSVMGFGFITVVVYIMIVSRTKSADELDEYEGNVDYEEALLRADVANLNRAQRRARAKALMKRQRRAAPTNTALGDHLNEPHDGEELNLIEAEQPLDDQHHQTNISQLSRKERNLAAKAAERKARHVMDEERREEQRQAMEIAKEEKRRRLKSDEEKAFQEKIEREKQRDLERQKKFDEWSIFLASPDGTVTMTVEEWIQESENRSTNVVSLLSLTKRFNASISDVILRIRQLVQEGRITGIVDEDQGVFLSFSCEQLASLASMIQEKGEVCHQHLSLTALELLK